MLRFKLVVHGLDFILCGVAGCRSRRSQVAGCVADIMKDRESHPNDVLMTAARSSRD
jgi:hypothetical protein